MFIPLLLLASSLSASPSYPWYYCNSITLTNENVTSLEFVVPDINDIDENGYNISIALDYTDPSTQQRIILSRAMDLYFFNDNGSCSIRFMSYVSLNYTFWLGSSSNTSAVGDIILDSNTTKSVLNVDNSDIVQDEYTFYLNLYYVTENLYNTYYNALAAQDAYQQGVDYGQQNPTQEVYDNIYNQGATSGYQSGYTAGYNDAFNTDTTALTIFSGILDVGLLPVNVFLAMLNFEVFGINVGGFITGILTIAVTIVLLKAVLGSGVGGGKSD